MWYDIIAALILLYAAWRGASRGAVWQLAAIGAVVLCIVAAEQLTSSLEPHIPLEQPLRHWVSVVIVYAGVSLVTFAIARKLRLWMEKIQFLEYDRHWGAIIGLIKGVAVVVVATTALLVLLPDARPMIRGSWTSEATRIVFSAVRPVLPQRVIQRIEPAFDPEREDELPGYSLPDEINVDVEL